MGRLRPRSVSMRTASRSSTRERTRCSSTARAVGTSGGAAASLTCSPRHSRRRRPRSRHRPRPSTRDSASASASRLPSTSTSASASISGASPASASADASVAAAAFVGRRLGRGRRLGCRRRLGGRLAGGRRSRLLSRSGRGLAAERLPRARDLEQLAHRLGGLGALAEPVHGLVVVDTDRRGIGSGVVDTHDLDESSVTGRPGVGRHHAVGRLLLLAHPHQAELDGHSFSSFFRVGASEVIG